LSSLTISTKIPGKSYKRLSVLIVCFLISPHGEEETFLDQSYKTFDLQKNRLIVLLDWALVHTLWMRNTAMMSIPLYDNLFSSKNWCDVKVVGVVCDL